MKEGKLAQYETRISRYYSGMEYETLVVIDQSRQRIVINDVDVPDEVVNEGFNKGSLFGQTLILNDRALIAPIVPQLGQYDPDRTTFVFPGRSGKRMDAIIEGSIVPKNKRQLIGTTRRVSESGRISGVELSRDAPIKSDQDVVVVDDVIMSGSTLDAIRRQFGSERRYFAISLLALSPIQNQYGFAQFGSGIGGYYIIGVNTIYQGISGIPSVISLSSLLGYSEKSKEIQEAYKRKFALEPDLFDSALAKINSYAGI